MECSPDLSYWRWMASRSGGLAAYVTSREAGFEPLSQEGLIALARGTSALRLIAVVSALSSLLTNRRTLSLVERARDQEAIARETCTPEVVEALAPFLREGAGRRVFVHDEQLLLVAKLAILHAAPEDTEISGDLLQRILLGANDLLAADEVYGDISGEWLSHEQEVELALRQFGSSSRQQTRYLMGRYFDLLVTRSRRRNQDGEGPSLDEAFRRYVQRVVGGDVTAADIETYLAYGFLYFATFSQPTSVREFVRIAEEGHVETYESQTAKAAAVTELRSLFGRSLQEFATDFAGRDTLTRASYVPFRNRPLLLRDAESPTPISMPFTVEKACTSVYWCVQQQFFHERREAGLSEYQQYVGELFQDYLSDLLARTYAQLNALRAAPVFHNEDAIRAASPPKRNDERPPFDGVIVEGDALIPIEITTISINVNTLEAGDLARFRRGLQRDFQKKFRQINDMVNGLISGDWVIPGVDMTRVRHIYPVLALLDPFPQTPATWEELRRVGIEVWPQWPDRTDRTARKANSEETVSVEIHAPQIIAAEEWEMLEAWLVWARQSLVALLRAKLDVPVYAALEMKQFLSNVVRILEPRNEHVATLTETAINSVRRALGIQAGKDASSDGGNMHCSPQPAGTS